MDSNKNQSASDQGAEASVWKKDVNLSSLFKRPKAQKQPSEVTAPGKSEEGGSVWKKELKLPSLFKRRKPASQPKPQLALPAAGDATPDSPLPAPPAVAVAAVDPGNPDAGAAAGAPGEPPLPTALTDAAASDPVVADAPPGAAPPEEATSEPGESQPTADEAGVAAAAAGIAAAAAVQGSAAPAPEAGAALANGTLAESVVEEAPRAAQRKGGVFKKDKGPERGENRGGPSAKPPRGKLPEVPLMRALNLLPQDIKLAKRTVRPGFVHAAIAVVALLVAGGMGFLYHAQTQQVDDRKSTIEDLQAQIAAMKATAEPDEGNVGTVQLAGEALSRATALSAALEERLTWDRLLRELSLTLPEGVWFESMATAGAGLTPAPPTTDGAPPPTFGGAATSVAITGYSMDQGGIAQLLSRLETIPEFSADPASVRDSCRRGRPAGHPVQRRRRAEGRRVRS